MKLAYGISDKPKFGQLIVFAIQQLLAIMAATLVVPVITNGNAGLTGENAMSTAAALFGAGVGTLVYVLFTKGKSPVFLGSSFAFLGSMAAAFAGAVSAQAGYVGLIIGAAFAGLVYVIIAIIVKLAGVKWVNKVMPAVVIGPTVAIIGLSLAGNAVGDLQTANAGGDSKIAIFCGLVTLAVTMLCSTYGKKMMKLIPVAFVVFAEHLADHKNISSIIEKDLLEDPGLHRTLLGDGVGSIAGAFFGGCPNTTYGESVACVAITGNASVVTIIAAAIGAIIISFLNPFVAFVNTIPSCVMGGVCMALYCFIAVSGLKMIQKVNLEANKNLFVTSVILIAGIGGLTVSFGKVTLTSIACALILGILANVMLAKGSDE